MRGRARSGRRRGGGRRHPRPTGRSGVDELPDGPDGVVELGAIADPWPQDERDLAAHRLGEARRELRGRAAPHLLEALRQLAAHGRCTPGVDRGEQGE